MDPPARSYLCEGCALALVCWWRGGGWGWSGRGGHLGGGRCRILPRQQIVRSPWDADGTAEDTGTSCGAQRRCGRGIRAVPAGNSLTSEELQQVLEGLQSGIVVWNARGEHVMVNEALCAMVGLTREKLMALPDLRGIVHAEERNDAVANNSDYRPGRELPSGVTSRRLLRSDGVTVHAQLSSQRVPFADGTAGVVMEIWDVTEQVEARTALEHSEDRFRTLFERSTSGLALLDERGQVSIFNPAMSRMLGYSPDEIASGPFSQILLPDARETTFAYISAVLAGEPVPERGESSFVRRDGVVIPAEVSASRVALADGSVRVLAQVRDLTEEKRLTADMIAAQKRDALGTLVAGVAHDFNNLLTAIGGSVEMAASDPDNPRWLTNARVAIATTSEGSLPQVEADAGQMQQVIMNLLVNARDAVMARVESEGHEGDYQPRIDLHMQVDDVLVPGHTGSSSMVCLSVSDNGAGMSREIVTRVFDPFYTTKDVGVGSGLGLSIVGNLVEQHGGVIDVESEPGSGSTFTVGLPAAAVADPDPADAAETGDDGAVSPEGAGRTVLIVDDEPHILEMSEAALNEAGYRASVASSGHAALRALASESFDAIVLDMAMPAPNGWQILEEIGRAESAPAVVVISGEAARPDVLEAGATSFLPKPFGPSQLVNEVWRALE